MNEKADAQEYRDPWQIDDGNRTSPGEKGPYLVQIAHRLGPFSRMPVRYGETDDGAMHGHREVLIEQGCCPHDHARANEIKRALEGVSTDKKNREDNQRRHASAAQHPIVDLQHVERAGEHQQIDDAGKQRHAGERAPTIAQGSCDVRMNHIQCCIPLLMIAVPRIQTRPSLLHAVWVEYCFIAVSSTFIAVWCRVTLLRRGFLRPPGIPPLPPPPLLLPPHLFPPLSPP